jgi:hypothetical protein
MDDLQHQLKGFSVEKTLELPVGNLSSTFEASLRLFENILDARQDADVRCFCEHKNCFSSGCSGSVQGLVAGAFFIRRIGRVSPLESI